jgi:hypothetical protein
MAGDNMALSAAGLTLLTVLGLTGLQVAPRGHPVHSSQKCSE